jgi:hypothetical protein
VSIVTQVLMVVLSVLLVGGVIAVVGSMLVRLLRAFLIDPQPSERRAGRQEENEEVNGSVNEPVDEASHDEEFFAAAGIWKDRDITAESLRKEAWPRH